MWRWLRPVLNWLLSAAATLATLAVLAGLFWYGHHNDWKIPLLSKSEKPEEEGKSDTEPPPKSFLWRVVELKDEAAQKIGLETALASEARLRDEIKAPAVLQYDAVLHSHLAPRATGTVWRVLKQQGDPVARGEVIAIIEAAEVGKAKSDLLTSRQLLDLREKAYRKAQAASSTMTDRQILEIEFAYQQARVQFLSAQQALINYGLPVPLEEWRTMSDELILLQLRKLGLPASVLESTKIETLSTNLLPMVSPLAGRVISLEAGLGEVVSPSQPLCLVAALDPVVGQLDLRLEDAARIGRKMPVRFRAEGQLAGASPDPAGTIYWISPEVDEKTRTVRVRARFANPEGQLRPNTFGTGWIALRERTGVVVPREAVQMVENTPVVFVELQDETFYQTVPVELGAELNGEIEVVGISPGDEVVTVGSHLLKAELLRDKIRGGE
jgi:cobalt-zinc-cadmium efflux system membrane fusion protein